MPTSKPDVWHIEHLKLVGYLLSLDHPYGRAKARTFIRYGFAADEAAVLASALFGHADTLPGRCVEGPAGTRLVFEGAMRAPFGMIPRVRSVWLLDADLRSARLVTAYPFDEA